MTTTVSVVIPVLDGARYLAEVLAALRAQDAELEILVIDSGSRDGSPEIARAGGAEVVSIPGREFGHGRTRNLGAERTSGELICFLTQDATPVPGWLAAFREAFTLADDVGAAFGPHLPRADTSPMIARELTDFFAGFSPDGDAVVLGAEDAMFLSNVNACYRRACWEQIRFPDVRYSEDQAFARAMGAHGWRRAFHPGAAVLHAHDYSMTGFMRRYFDEYRGLHATSGHVERIGARSTVREVRGLVGADRRWMRQEGWSPRAQLAWTARSAAHHTGRKAFAALGSRADRLPEPVQRAISLEGRAATGGPSGGKTTVPQPARRAAVHEDVTRVSRDGAAPLLAPVAGMADAERLHIAVVIPPFRAGSGGHSTLYNLLTRLEDRGHTVSTWLYDPAGRQRDEWPAVVRHDLREYFRPPRGPVFKGFDAWYGADVVLATGWDTVYPVMRLDHCRARAYLVQDHEPEFFATSAESVFAERSYTYGLHCIAASPWLRDLVAGRYGADASAFQLGVDHDVYRPRPVERRRDTIIFYARSVTPRRAVPLGMLALAELERRRPQTRFVLFGDERPADAPFAYEHLGLATPEELSWAYSEATVGLSLSLTNYSLIPQEMLACGLPCVELGGRAIESVYGADGPIELTSADPIELADALERLLDDRALWRERSDAGRAFVSAMTWDAATDQVEARLRQALRSRERDPHAEIDSVADSSTVLGREANRRAVPVEPATGQEVTALFNARLDDTDRAAVEAALDSAELGYWVDATPATRDQLAILLGVWHRVPSVLEKTGLRSDEPPEDVHSMARGPLAAGGALYYADMLAEDLRRVGSSLAEVKRGLGLRLLVRAGGSRARGRVPRRRLARRGPQCGGDRVGARAPARHRVPPVPADAAAGVPRRHLRPRRGDLHLVALRRDRGHRMARGDASRHPPRRLLRVLHPRPAIRRALRGHRRTVGGAAQPDPPGALPAGVLVRARVRRAGRLGGQEPRVGHDLLHPGVAGAPRPPALVDGPLRRGTERRQPGHVRPAATLAGGGSLRRKRAATARRCGRGCPGGHPRSRTSGATAGSRA